MGHGAYDATAKTIVRNVTSSTNADARINLTGSARLLVTPRAVDIDPRAMTSKATLAVADIIAVLDSADDEMKSATVGAILAAVGILSSDASPDRFVDRLLSYDTSASAAKRIAFPAPRGHIFGSMVANNATDATNDIDFSPGECASDNTDARFLVSASALTKQLDAVWAVGSNQGMRDPTSNGGAIMDGTWHLFRIGRSDTGVCDYFASLSTAPTLPTNYDYKRRIASIMRASGAIVAFKQFDDFFFLGASSLDYNATPTPDTDFTVTLKVPTGIRVEPMLKFGAQGNSNYSNIVVRSPDLMAAEASPALDSGVTIAGMDAGGTWNGSTATRVGSSKNRILTNTSAQITARTYAPSGSVTAHVRTYGHVDTRGRLS